ncbi:MAG: tetratricopeptide repeat protein [Limisphaerales bacterium]
MGKRFKVIREQPRAAATTAAEPVPAVRFTWQFYALAVALIAATFAVYWQTTHFPLLDVDDPDYVVLNTNVRAGLTWETFRWAFNLGYAANWHPLTWLSHMADCQFFGMLPGQIHGTGGHHLINLLLHSGSVVLLFGLLHKLTRQLWPSAIVAALFAVHPLHVESVAWVAERKDVLSTFFLMLTLCAYAKYAATEGTTRRITFYVLTAAAYACGLMSKQMLVSAPILFLLLDYWPLNRLQRVTRRPSLATFVLEKMPFVIMAIGASIAVIVAQRSGGAMSSRILFSSRINNAIVTYVIYLADMFYPRNLAHYYPHEAYNWQTLDILGSLAILGAITAATLWLVRARPYLLVGWLWYLITLVPVIGIVQVGGQARADRYTYIPSIGIFIMVAFGAADLLKGFFAKRELAINTRRAIQIAVAIVAIAATGTLAAAAHQQVGYWQSGETLCKHTLSVTKNNWFVHSALAAILNTEGDHLRARGKSEEANRKNQEAVEHLKETLAIMPSMANAHVILANAYLDMNKLDDAVKEFQLAITLQPENALAHCNLANTLKKQGKMADAISQYEEALRYEPNLADTRYNYALALSQSGKTDQALQEFQRTLQCFPSDLAAYWTQQQMAQILEHKGQKSEAIALLRNAVTINDRSHVDPSGNVARGMLERLEKSP